jgi:hypothetical protein
MEERQDVRRERGEKGYEQIKAGRDRTDTRGRRGKEGLQLWN